MTDLHSYSDIADKIDRAILIIRGQKVMIDSDLAEGASETEYKSISKGFYVSVNNRRKTRGYRKLRSP